MNKHGLSILAVLLFIFVLCSSQTYAQISSCGTIVTSGTLTGDLTNDSTCLVVGADNLIIDGGGFSLLSTSGVGTAISNLGGFDNITIRNFANISNFSFAINATFMDDSVIQNNTVEITGVVGATGNIFGGGVLVLFSDNVNISDNNISVDRASSFVTALGFLFASNLTASDNLIAVDGSNAAGIFGNTKSSFIEDNSVNVTVNASSAIITIFDAAGFTTEDTFVTGNDVLITANDSDAFGIQGDRNQILNNTVLHLGNDTPEGMDVDGVDNLVANNSIFMIGHDAIVFEGESNNTIIRQNSFTSSGNDSVLLRLQGNFSQVYNNNFTSLGFGSQGITIESLNHLVENNTMRSEGNDSSSVSFGSGNFSILRRNNITSIGNLTDVISIFESRFNLLSNNIINFSGNQSIAFRLQENTSLNNITNNTVNFLGTPDGTVLAMEIGPNSTSTNISLNTFLMNNSIDISIDFSNITLSNQTVSNYSFNNAGLTIENLIGRITFINNNMTLSGNNLSNDVTITDNNITINSSSAPGLNVSANLTFFNPQLSGIGVSPLFDGSFCPTNICAVLQPSKPYLFNVTRFSSYSLRQGCGTVNGSITLHENLTSVGSCFTATSDDISLNGNGFSITGNSAGTGVSVFTVSNVTVANFSGIINYQGGIIGEQTENSLFTNNTVINSSNVSIVFISRSNFSTASNNTILNINVTTISSEMGTSDMSNNNSFSNNVIFSNGADGRGIIIVGSVNNSVENNFVRILGNASFGIGTLSSNDTIMRSNVISVEEDNSLGLVSFLAFRDIIENNSVSVLTTSTAAFGGIASVDSTVNSNLFNASASATTSVLLTTSSSNNSFSHNTLQTSESWISTDASSSGNNFSNTTFQTNNGSIQLLGNSTIPVSLNITTPQLNIALNNASLNSSNLTFFNGSGIVTLFNINSLGLSNRIPFLNSIPCPSTICTLIQNSDTYIFSVTQFSDYSVGSDASGAQGGGSASQAHTPFIRRSGGGGSGTSSTASAMAQAVAQATTSTNLPPIQFPSKVCDEVWSCDVWQDCVDGKQKRNCNDKNSCGTTNKKPAEERSCQSEKTKDVESIASIKESTGVLLEQTKKTVSILASPYVLFTLVFAAVLLGSSFFGARKVLVKRKKLPSFFSPKKKAERQVQKPKFEAPAISSEEDNWLAVLKQKAKALDSVKFKKKK